MKKKDKLVNIENKRKSEKIIVKQMIEIYCKHHHKSVDLCDSCKEILDYSWMKIDKCPVMETKTFCSKCSIHCYNQEMAEKIRIIMRFSGPRIFMYHPIITLKHAYVSRKGKK